jgi:hypothetical protein
MELSIPNKGPDKIRIAGSEKLTPGKHTIDFDFKYDGGGLGKGGLGTLTVDGKKVAESSIEQTSPAGRCPPMALFTCTDECPLRGEERTRRERLDVG